jgi:hypothetical protein
MVAMRCGEARDLTDDELNAVQGGVYVVAAILIGVGSSLVANWLSNGSGNGKAWNENFKGCVGL